jgi:hypothetical protein
VPASLLLLIRIWMMGILAYTGSSTLWCSWEYIKFQTSHIYHIFFIFL